MEGELEQNNLPLSSVPTRVTLWPLQALWVPGVLGDLNGLPAEWEASTLPRLGLFEKPTA